MNMKKTLLTNYGMRQNLAIDKGDNKYAFENRNVKILESEDGKYCSITNIKGPHLIGYDNGTILASCITPEYLVLFIKNSNKDMIVRYALSSIATSTDLTMQLGVILYQGYELNFSKFHTFDTLYFEENANIKKVYWCESWDEDSNTMNCLRFINLVTEGERNGGAATPYTKNEFEFYTTIGNPMRVKFQKQWTQDSEFPAGVVQYFFTYYNTNGSETKICQDSPLITLTARDRGSTVEEKPGCSVKISITDYDTNFDYIRIYSAVRSTRDGELSVHIVGDLAIPEDGKTLTFQDVHKNQETIQASQIYFIGGTPLAAKTITQKDGVLFAGNIKTSQITIPDEIQKYFDKDYARENQVFTSDCNDAYTDDFLMYDSAKDVYWSKIVKFTRYRQEHKLEDIEEDRTLLNTRSLLFWDETYYYYKNFIYPSTTLTKDDYYRTLFAPTSNDSVIDINADDRIEIDNNIIHDDSVHTVYKRSDYSLNGNDLYPYTLSTKDSNVRYVGFKRGEIYRFGLQFQDNRGQWTEVLYIGDAECRCSPAVNTETKEIYYTNAVVKLPDCIKDICADYNLVNYRLVYADPELHNGRNIVAQGIINPTVFSPNDRYLGSYWSYPSWSFRPVGGDLPYHHFQRMASYWERTAEISNIKGTETVTELPKDVEALIQEVNENKEEDTAIVKKAENTKNLTLIAICPQNNSGHTTNSFILTCQLSDECWESSFTSDTDSITNCYCVPITTNGSYSNVTTEVSSNIEKFSTASTFVKLFDDTTNNIYYRVVIPSTTFSGGNALDKLGSTTLIEDISDVRDDVIARSYFSRALARGTVLQDRSGIDLPSGIRPIDALYDYYYMFDNSKYFKVNLDAQPCGIKNVASLKIPDYSGVDDYWVTTFKEESGWEKGSVNYAHVSDYVFCSLYVNYDKYCVNLAKNGWMYLPTRTKRLRNLFSSNGTQEVAFSDLAFKDGYEPQLKSLYPLFSKAKNITNIDTLKSENKNPSTWPALNIANYNGFDNAIIFISVSDLSSQNGDIITTSTKQQKILMNNDALFVDNSVVTFNTPDSDALSSVVNASMNLDIVGAAYVNHSYAKREVQLSNPGLWKQAETAESYNDRKYIISSDNKRVITMAAEYSFLDNYLKEVKGVINPSEGWEASNLITSGDNTTLVAMKDEVGYFLTHTWENNGSITGITTSNTDIEAEHDGLYRAYNTTDNPIKSDYATIKENDTYNYKIAEETAYTISKPKNVFFTGPITVSQSADAAYSFNTNFFGIVPYQGKTQKTILGKQDVKYVVSNTKDAYPTAEPGVDALPSSSSSSNKFIGKTSLNSLVGTIDKTLFKDINIELEDGSTLESTIRTGLSLDGITQIKDTLIDYSANKNDVTAKYATNEDTTGGAITVSNAVKNENCFLSYYSTPHAVFSLGAMGTEIALLPVVQSYDLFDNDILYEGNCNRTFFETYNKNTETNKFTYPWARTFDFERSFDIKTAKHYIMDEDSVWCKDSPDSFKELTNSIYESYTTGASTTKWTWSPSYDGNPRTTGSTLDILLNMTTNYQKEIGNYLSDVWGSDYKNTVDWITTIYENEDCDYVYLTVFRINNITARKRWNKVNTASASSNVTAAKTAAKTAKKKALNTSAIDAPDTFTDLTPAGSVGEVIDNNGIWILPDNPPSYPPSTDPTDDDTTGSETTVTTPTKQHYITFDIEGDVFSIKVNKICRGKSPKAQTDFFIVDIPSDYGTVFNPTKYSFSKSNVISEPTMFSNGNQIYSISGYKKYKKSISFTGVPVTSGNASTNGPINAALCYWKLTDNLMLTLQKYLWTYFNSTSWADFVDSQIRTAVDTGTPKYRSQLLDDSINRGNVPTLYIGELRRDLLPKDLYGGTSDSALENLTWLPASNYTSIDDEIYQTTGDTYFQRYDCLKTYPCDDEGINKVRELASVMIETHKNLDARTDVNRWNFNTQASPNNFGLYNDVYDQKNNIFTSSILPELMDQTEYKNTCVWSSSKNYAGRVDTWTNLSTNSSALTNTEISKFVNYDNNLFSFDFNDVSAILYNQQQFVQGNDNTFITTDFNTNVNIQLLNDKYGTHNNNVLMTKKGIYFVEDNKNTIVRIRTDGKFEEIPLNKLDGFFKKNIKIVSIAHGTPLPNRCPIYFNYDALHDDVYIYFRQSISFGYCVVFNELIDEFTSFIDIPIKATDIKMFSYMGNVFAVLNNGLSIHAYLKLFQYNTNDFLNYNSGSLVPSITYRTSPEILNDKIFTNLEMQVDTGVSTDNSTKNEGEVGFPFESIRLWTEYQDTGDVKLTYKPYGICNLQSKFRTWRITLPRDKTNIRDRIRNPWVTFTLTGKKNLTSFELHNMVLDYLS